LNDYVLSAILGIIEGLTEFLPVSSTAHLRIAEALIGHWTGREGILDDPYWKMYTIVIQLGAILSLLVYFQGRIRKFMATFPRGERGNRTIFNHPLTLVLIAFVLTAGPMYKLHKIVKANLGSLYIMGAALLVGGIIMWMVDAIYTHPRTEHVEEMSFFQAAWIGIMQILSGVIPGTSRSMITIAAGQVAEMSRSAALEFSFFLSIPTMIAATGYELFKTIHPGKDGGHGLAPAHIDGHGWVVLGIGFIISFVVALGVVAWFMGWVRKRGFAPFAVYRIIVGVAVLIWAWRTTH
jgi:undecaprenyl-diphosphatase